MKSLNIKRTLYLLFVTILCSNCASKKSIESNTYDIIVYGRLINYGMYVETRELTSHVSIEIIVDEVLKGKVSTLDKMYPKGDILKLEDLFCLNPIYSCEIQQIANFEYFNHYNNLNAKAVMLKAPSKNELFDTIILYFNDIKNNGQIGNGNETAVLYNLEFVDFKQLSEREFSKCLNKLKRNK